MKNYSKVFLLVLVIVLSLGVIAGCNPDNPSTPGNGGGGGGGSSAINYSVDFVLVDSAINDGAETKLYSTTVSFSNLAVVGEGSKVEAPSKEALVSANSRSGILTTLKEQGKVFFSWYKDAELTTLWNFEKDKVLDNTKIYAKFVLRDDISPVVSENLVLKDLNIADKDLSAPFNRGIISEYAFVKAFDNEKTMFNFTTEFPVNNGISVSVFSDEGLTKVVSKTAAPLVNGENIFYIKMEKSYQGVVMSRTIKLLIERSPMYSVVFYNEINELPVSTALYEKGAKITAPSISRVGSSFVGWSTNIGGQSSKYWNFETDTVNGNTIFYAVWSKNNYKVTLDLGNDIGLLPYAGQTEFSITFDESAAGLHTYLKVGNDIVLPQHKYGTFDGWYYGETKVFDKNGIGVIDWKFAEDVTLTAKWVYKQYAVELLSEDELKGSVSGAGKFSYGSQVAIKALPKIGFTFLGWKNTSDPTGNYISTAAEYKFEMSSATDHSLTAYFTKTTGALKLNLNYTGAPSIADKTITFGDAISADLIIPESRVGARFVGWALENGTLVTDSVAVPLVSDADYWDNGLWTISQNSTVSLKAIWDNKFSIRILNSDVNAGTISSDMSGNTVSDKTISYGSYSLVGKEGLYEYQTQITISAPVANPGYTFNKWVNLYGVAYTNNLNDLEAYSADGTNPFVSGSVNLENEIYLVAVWNYDEITASLEVNGGEALENAQAVVYYNQPFVLPVPTISSGFYSFGGWVTNANPAAVAYDDLDFVTDKDGASLQKLTADTTLYAYWKPNQYSVEVSVKDDIGGTIGGVTTDNYDYGKTLDLFVASTAVGYKFDSWEKLVGSSWTEITGEDETFSFTVNGAIVIRCVFKPIVSAVTFDTSTYKGVTVDGRNIEFGEKVETPFAVLTADNHFDDIHGQHEFVGWYYTKRGQDITVTEADGIFKDAWNIDEEAVVLKAKWKSIFVMSGNTLTGLTETGLLRSSIIIPDAVDNVSVLAIGDNAFAPAARNLKSIYISTYIKSIGQGAFAFCDKLTDISFAPNCELATIESEAFKYCSLLKVLDLPESVNSIIDKAFMGCSALKTITLKGSVVLAPLFGTTAYENSYRVLYNGSSYYVPSALKTVVISSTSTMIAESAYKNCYEIQTVTFRNPQSITAIGNHAFENCNNLTSVDLSGVKDIGTGAFAYTGLNSTIVLKVNNLGINAFKGAAITGIDLSKSELKVLPINAFANCTQLVNVSLPEIGVTTISDSVFSGCNSLTTLAAADIASVLTIGRESFKNTGLDATVVANFTAIKRVGQNAFLGSAWEKGEAQDVIYVGGRVAYAYKGTTPFSISATTISIADGAFTNMASVGGNIDLTACSVLEYIGEKAFEGTAITGLITPTNLSMIATEAFRNCAQLVSVNVSADTIGLRAFYNCLLLNSLTLSTNVKMIGEQAFSAEGNGNGITAVKLPVTLSYLGASAFENCKALASLSFDTTLGASDSFYTKFTVDDTDKNLIKYDSVAFSPTLLSIEAYTFRNTAITSVELPFYITSIGVGAFENCAKLTTVKLNGDGVTEDALKSKLTVIRDEAFQNDVLLASISLSKEVTSIGAYAFADCKALPIINIAGVTYLSTGVFSGCTSLNIPKANFNASIQSVSDYAFKDCTSLSSIQLSAIRHIGKSAFYGCVMLESVNILSTASVAEIGDEAFAYTGITSINIPNEVKKIGTGAFSGCTKLIVVNISTTTSKLVSLGSSAFQGCHSLSSFSVPTELKIISANAFEDCTSLTTIVMHNAITTIDNDAFNGCTALANLEFGRNITTIEARAFKDCDSLVNITLPVALLNIGREAFANCNNLSTVTVRENVVSIGNRAFADNGALTAVTFMGTEPATLGAEVFLNSNEGVLQIKVQTSYVGKYKTSWPAYANSIVALG